jgi:hypothetical protein
MGIMKKDDLELDFRGLRTENYSSTVPYMGNLTADAKMLVNRLPQNNVKIGLFQDSENHDMYKMFESNTKQTNDNNFSETSPFISSDVYNNLVNNQLGGGDSSTSSSSSSSSSSSDMSRGGGKEESEESTTSESDSETNKSHKHKKHSDKSSSSDETEKLEEELTEKMLSSMSRESKTNSQSSNNSFISSSANQSDSEILSTISLNHKGRYNYTESINTSDINIVSVDD